jgi:hypothetical protein
VRGLGWTSSGRSIFVAFTVSAASRVNTRTSSALIPATCDVVPLTSGIHSPPPSNSPSAGSFPLPSISDDGESPVNRAT